MLILFVHTYLHSTQILHQHTDVLLIYFTGLFKVEWTGKGFIGLSAKTYFCYGDKGGKCSTKGINKTQDITREHFLSVIRTKKSVSATNRGFIFKNNNIFTYEMSRIGLSYFYCKRKVLDDGVSTTYLDL